MFQMSAPALEAEVGRRREIALATMRAIHGSSTAVQRVANTTRVRHVVVALAMGAVVLA